VSVTGKWCVVVKVDQELNDDDKTNDSKNNEDLSLIPNIVVLFGLYLL